ncbi:type 2 periplasmic-binding domain-containing protein [Flindersiella endophytica]
MRLRRAAAAAAGLALLAGQVACGSDSAGEKDTVTMWIYPVVADKTQHRKFWNDTVAEFRKANPGIDVEVTVYPWANRDRQLRTAVSGGKGPDIVYLTSDQLPTWENSLLPAEEYLPKATVRDYRENAVESVSPRGNLLAAPLLMTVVTPVCNKKVFAQAGVSSMPASWDDFAALGPKFAAKGLYLTDYPADPAGTLDTSFYIYLWEAGGDVFSPDGRKVAFNSPQGLEALTYLRKLADEKLVDPQPLTKVPPAEQQAVAQNKVACTQSSAPRQLAGYWGKENVSVLAPFKQAKDVTYGSVGSLAILKRSAHKDEAGTFVAYVTRPDVMKKYLALPGYFSPRTSQSSLYASDPILGAAEKHVDLATAGPPHPRAREVMAALAPEIQAALLGRKSPEQALADAEKAANAVIR